MDCSAVAAAFHDSLAVPDAVADLTVVAGAVASSVAAAAVRADPAAFAALLSGYGRPDLQPQPTSAHDAADSGPICDETPET